MVRKVGKKFASQRHRAREYLSRNRKKQRRQFFQVESNFSKSFCNVCHVPLYEPTGTETRSFYPSLLKSRQYLINYIDFIASLYSGDTNKHGGTARLKFTPELTWYSRLCKFSRRVASRFSPVGSSPRGKFVSTARKKNRGKTTGKRRNLRSNQRVQLLEKRANCDRRLPLMNQRSNNLPPSIRRN